MCIGYLLSSILFINIEGKKYLYLLTDVLDSLFEKNFFEIFFFTFMIKNKDRHFRFNFFENVFIYHDNII